jgi:hypothetical protein
MLMLKLFQRRRAKPALLRPEAIDLARQRLEAGDERVAAAAEQVRRLACQSVSQGLYTVVDKPRYAPSGDPHDFFSIGTYWWPNPDTEDGLPYVRRDGEINPESMESDTGKVRRLCRDVQALALAWRLFRDEDCARHCAALLKAWFINPDTSMNPHLEYAQCVPGVSHGRSWGVIDTRGFRYLVDASFLIRDHDAWSESDHEALQAWMKRFLDWLLTSRSGRKESKARNNHGTWYSAQALALALFTEQQGLAEKLARQARKRIELQIDGDGVQREEYKRTRPLTYCTMNLWAFFEVASLCERTQTDLWRYRAPSGGSLELAARWLLPYLQRRKDWPDREIVDYRPENYLSLFRRAAIHYDIAFEPDSLPLEREAVDRDLIHILHPL